MYKNLKIIYHILGKNIAIGIEGNDVLELELLLNSFFNYGLIDQAEFTTESDNFRYIVTPKTKLNKYLFLSSLFQFLNESGQELDSNNEPNVVQSFFAKKIAQAKFNSWSESRFYPVNFMEKVNLNDNFQVKDQDLEEEEKVLVDNLSYEVE